MGLGTITDCLSALKYQVFEQHDLSMAELLEALDADFAGREPVRQLLLNKPPKWGNDHDEADDLARRVFEAYYAAVNGRPNTRGGHYRINLLPTTCHVYFGKMTGATPDGRRARTPLSEGISPVQGADRRGPTAVIKSAAKMDHVRTGGTLLNQKFLPNLLATEEGLDKLAHLVRGYFRMDGHHIQFNVVDAATLRAAQRAAGAVPRPDRAGGRLQRLLRRPGRGAAGGDHPPHRPRRLLINRKGAKIAKRAFGPRTINKGFLRVLCAFAVRLIGGIHVD